MWCRSPGGAPVRAPWRRNRTRLREPTAWRASTTNAEAGASSRFEFSIPVRPRADGILERNFFPHVVGAHPAGTGADPHDRLLVRRRLNPALGHAAFEPPVIVFDRPPVDGAIPDHFRDVVLRI